MPYQPIESYGIIGDLYTVALVGLNGSIDMMSFPHFDSPTVFAAMLDDAKGGRFQIQPELDHLRPKQMYLPDTNVLVTRHLSATGVSEIIDFMPVEAFAQAHNLVRIVNTIRGEVTYRMDCSPRFDYARAPHKADLRSNKREMVFESKGKDKTALRLRSSVDLDNNNGDAVATFTLHAGETAAFVLEEAEEGDSPDTDIVAFCQREFAETSAFWRRWIGRSAYHGRWHDMINRSALTLKLMTSQEHGSLIAAATFGLPEHVGGVRNWDYRYTWIRDSSFALYALLRLGFTDEARHFMKWLVERCREEGGALQIMYGIDGRKQLHEENLTNLEGYMKSSPVRIGNAAYSQIQLDIYGELLDAVYLYDKYCEPVSYELWTHLNRLVEWVRLNWRLKDEGIWEVRGGAQEFLYSRLLCWVAIDRGIRLAIKRSLPCDLDGWTRTRNEIYHEIHTAFWSPKRNAFVQYKGSENLDAACLLMPLVRFIGPTDPRWLSTLDAISKELLDDMLVYRYRVGEAAHDGLTGEEGTFSMCSFWWVECLARAGRIDEARLAFEKMLGYANHVGLYAEELGPRGEHLGNFPQAFTHLGLISAAFQLDRALSHAGWRA